MRATNSIPCAGVFCDAGSCRGKGDGEDEDSSIDISFQESAIPEKEAAFPLTRPPLPLIHALGGGLVENLLELLRSLVQQRLWISVRVAQHRLHGRIKRSVHFLRLLAWLRAQRNC